jgi:hypothetical protein
MAGFIDENHEGQYAYELLFYIADGTKKVLDPSFDYYEKITWKEFTNASKFISESGARLNSLDKDSPYNASFMIQGNYVAIKGLEKEIRIASEFGPFSPEIRELAEMFQLPAPRMKIEFSRN